MGPQFKSHNVTFPSFRHQSASPTPSFLPTILEVSPDELQKAGCYVDPPPTLICVEIRLLESFRHCNKAGALGNLPFGDRRQGRQAARRFWAAEKGDFVSM